MDRIITPSPDLGWTFHQRVRVRIAPYRNIFGRQRFRAILEGEWMGCWRQISDGRGALGFFGLDFSVNVNATSRTQEEAEKVGHQWLDEIENYKIPGVLAKRVNHPLT